MRDILRLFFGADRHNVSSLDATVYGVLVLIILSGGPFAMVAWSSKPDDMKRSAWTETIGNLGFERKYNVVYNKCRDKYDNAQLNFIGMAFGQSGFGEYFYASDDEDAKHFARTARPQCHISSLSQMMSCRKHSHSCDPSRDVHLEAAFKKPI